VVHSSDNSVGLAAPEESKKVVVSDAMGAATSKPSKGCEEKGGIYRLGQISKRSCLSAGWQFLGRIPHRK